MFNKGYGLSLNYNRLSVVWYIGQYAKGRVVYIHGRDYHEIFENNDLAPGKDRNLRRIELGFGDPKFEIALGDRPTISLLRHIREDARQGMCGPSEYVKGRLSSRQSGGELLSRTADSYLATIRNSGKDQSIYVKEISRLQSLLSPAIYNNICVISLDRMEDSLICATILNIVANANNSSIIVLGPSRYKGILTARNVPRPQISENDILKLYSRTTDTDINSSSRHFEQWASLNTNPSVVRRGSSRRRKLTLGDANRFFRWEPDAEDEDFPEPVEGPIQVEVVGGRVVEKSQPPESTFDADELGACVNHLINAIDDAQDGPYLDNWSPGAKNKMQRVYTILCGNRDILKIEKRDALELCMDANAFLMSYYKNKEELGPSGVSDMDPVAVHLEFLMSQFSSWKSFSRFADQVKHGRAFSDSYRQTLSAVAQSFSELPEAAASDTVRDAMRRASKVVEESSDQELVHASMSVRNVLSGTLKGLANPANVIGKAVGEGAAEAAKESAKTGLLAAISGMRDAMVSLAGQENGLFGWLLRAMKRLPWDN